MWALLHSVLSGDCVDLCLLYLVLHMESRTSADVLPRHSFDGSLGKRELRGSAGVVSPSSLPGPKCNSMFEF